MCRSDLKGDWDRSANHKNGAGSDTEPEFGAALSAAQLALLRYRLISLRSVWRTQWSRSPLLNLRPDLLGPSVKQRSLQCRPMSCGSDLHLA